MSENKGKTYSFNVCSKCKSNCCQNAKPPLTQNRKNIIQEYLKKQKIEIDKPFAKDLYSYPAVDKLIFCKFLNKKTRKCSVHPVKPETCVSGPITFDINFSAKKVEWFLKKEEICLLAGVLNREKNTFYYYLETAKAQLTQLIRELQADELRAIVKIDEPQTLKIGEDDLPLEVVRKLGLK